MIYFSRVANLITQKTIDINWFALKYIIFYFCFSDRLFWKNIRDEPLLTHSLFFIKSSIVCFVRIFIADFFNHFAQLSIQSFILIIAIIKPVVYAENNIPCPSARF